MYLCLFLYGDAMNVRRCILIVVSARRSVLGNMSWRTSAPATYEFSLHPIGQQLAHKGLVQPQAWNAGDTMPPERWRWSDTRVTSQPWPGL